jgi:hypothetical protein
MARYKLTLILDDVIDDGHMCDLDQDIRLEIAPDCTIVSSKFERIGTDEQPGAVLKALADGDRNG